MQETVERLNGAMQSSDGNWEASFIAMSPAEQVADFLRGIATIEFEIGRLAKRWRIMEDAKVIDMTQFRHSLVKYVRLVAYGHMLKEIVTRYYGKPLLLQLIGSLPMPDQKHFAEGGKVTLFLFRPGEDPDPMLKDPLSLKKEQVVQVFSVGHLNDVEAQRSVVDRQAAKRRGRRREWVGEDFHMDYERQVVRVRKKGEYSFASFIAVVEAIRE